MVNLDVFLDQSCQLPVVNLSGRPQTLHLSADPVESPGEELHACGVKQVQGVEGMRIGIEGMKCLQDMKSLPKNVLRRNDLDSFESGDKIF